MDVELEPEPDAQPHAVWPENWDSLQLFLGLATQWRLAGQLAAPVGLDYVAIAPTARLMRIPIGPDRFEDLRAMEHAALEIFAARFREG